MISCTLKNFCKAGFISLYFYSSMGFHHPESRANRMQHPPYPAPCKRGGKGGIIYKQG
jgi:hypothetical protein